MQQAAQEDGAAIAERTRFLRLVPLFADMSDESVATIAAMTELHQAAAGESIITGGELGDSMYIVVTGQLRAHAGDMVFNSLGPGEYFGEMALLDPEVRSASVTAEEDSTLYVLHRDHIISIIYQQEQATQQLVSMLCRRLRSLMRMQVDSFTYIRQVDRIAAIAQQIERGVYEFAGLDAISRRDDELGHLARVFMHMASEIHNREQRLQREVQALQIEIDRTRQNREVATIVESEYFQNLKKEAQRLRDELQDES